jgi:ribosomal protein L40E
MSRLEKEPEGSKTYYYKICPHCGTRAHIDSVNCLKCGGRMRAPGGIEALHSTPVDPGVKRINLDHPRGCPACGGGCGYCWSFGLKEPSEKAQCKFCAPARAVCCLKARKLPVIFDVMPELTMAGIMGGVKREYVSRVKREETFRRGSREMLVAYEAAR